MLILSAGNFAAIYRAINEYLSKGYAVVYSAELDSPIQILKKMMQSGILPDAEDYVQSGMLTIVDESTIRIQKTQLDGTQLADLRFTTALDVRRKAAVKKVIVLCNTDALLIKGDYAKQIDFEQAINKRFEAKDGSSSNQMMMEVICCYNAKTVEGQIPLKHLFSLVNAHQRILDKDWKHKDWYPSTAIEIITRGIANSLDERTADLILKTFKLVYKIDENTIISNPAVFEDTLEKMIGKHAADTVLQSITNEFRRSIFLQY